MPLNSFCASAVKHCKPLALHQWLGFQLSIFLLLFSLSGVICLIDAPLRALLSGQYQPTLTTANIDWQKLETNLAAQYSGMQIYNVAVEPENYLVGKVSLMQAKTPDSPAHKIEVYFDRNTQELVAEQHQADWLHKVGRFHRNLSQMRALNIWLLAIGPLMLLVICLSFYQYRHRFVSLWQRKSNSKRVLHQWLMAWCVPMTLLIALSASWFFIESVLWQNKISVYPNLPKSDGQVREMALPLSQLMLQVQKAAPQRMIRSVSYPSSGTGTFSVLLQSEQALVYYRAEQLHFNAFTGQLLHHIKPEHVVGLAWWADLMRYLHYGEASGLMWLLLLASLGFSFAIYLVMGSYYRQLKHRQLKARFGLVKFVLLMVGNVLAIALACYGIFQLSNSAPYYGWPVVSPILAIS